MSLKPKRCYRGYAVVASVFANRFVGLGTFYSLGLYVMPIQRSFDIGAGMAALFPSVIGGLSFLVVLFSGPIQDWLIRNTSWGISPLFAIGSLLVGGGTVGASFAKSFGIFLFCNISTATGLGFVAWASPGVVALWFVKRKGAALSFALMGSGFGTLAYVQVTSKLLIMFQPPKEECRGDASLCDGWRTVMRITGFVSGLVLFAASMPMCVPKEGEVEAYEGTDNEDVEVISADVDQGEEEYEEVNGGKESLRSSAHRLSRSSARRFRRWTISIIPALRSRKSDTHATTQSMRSSVLDLVQHSRSLPDVSRRSTMLDRMCLENSSNEGPGFSRESLLVNWATRKAPNFTLSIRDIPQTNPFIPALSMRQSLQTRTYACLIWWAFWSSFAYDTFFMFVPLSAQDANIPLKIGSLALSLTGIMLLVGNLVLGFLSDIIGYVRTLQFTMLGCTIALFLWPFCTSGWSLCLVASAYSFFACTFPMNVSIIAEAYGVASRDCIMTLFAIFQVACAPGTLIGPIVTGVLAEHFSLQSGIFFLGGIFLIGTLALFFIPKPEAQIEKIITQWA